MLIYWKNRLMVKLQNYKSAPRPTAPTPFPASRINGRRCRNTPCAPRLSRHW